MNKIAEKFLRNLKPKENNIFTTIINRNLSNLLILLTALYFSLVQNFLCLLGLLYIFFFFNLRIKMEDRNGHFSLTCLD